MHVDLKMLGDSALVMQFEQRIDEAISAQVIATHHAIEAAAIPGVAFLVPAYCTLTIGFNPLAIARDELSRRLAAIVETIEAASSARAENLPQRKWSIPVCYDRQFGLDLDEVTSQTNLSVEALIASHTSMTYRVFMLGFLPGFAYLGPTPEDISCTRKLTPRPNVPARSVAIAGRQTAIYPLEAPGGWQVIGRTPVSPFDPARDDPFLFRPGDAVKFRAIEADEYLQQMSDPSCQP